MNFKEMVLKAMDKLESENTIQTIIEDKLTKCMEEVIGDQFKWSGELKKQIEDHLKEHMKLDMGRINIHEYNEYLAKKVQSILNEELNIEASKGATEMVKSALDVSTLSKKEYNLDEFMVKVFGYEDIDKDQLEIDYDGAFLKCSVHAEVSSNLIHLYFDNKEDRARYMCRHSLTLDKETGRVEGVRAKFSGEFLDNQSSFLISCKYEGVKIKNITRDITEEDYSLDVSDNYDRQDLMCGC